MLEDLPLLERKGYLVDGQIRVLIQYDTLNSFLKLQTQLLRENGRILTTFEPLNLLSAEIPYTSLANLQSKMQIFLDKKFHACLDQSVPLIKPPAISASMRLLYSAISSRNFRIDPS